MSGGFEALGLMPEILRAVEDLNWLLPTDVQDEAIPLILGGGDVMVASETGSGKTAAFGLPVIQCVHEKLREHSKESAGTGKADTISPSDFRLSAADKDAFLQLSPDGLNCTSVADKTWSGCRGNYGVRSGKYYYEVTVLQDGFCRLGWSTTAANHELGRDSQGFGYGGTGMKSNNNAFEPYGEKYGKNDVISCLLDLENNTISYAKNGKDLGICFGIPEQIRGAVLFPSIAMKASSITINFGASKFSYSTFESEGYVPLGKADESHRVGATSSQAGVILGHRTPLAIIIEPSRDLAEQVYQSINDMSRYITGPDIKTALLVGGDADSRKHYRQIVEGCDIIIGTTGKIQDMVKNKQLILSQVKFFVLDEADRLIETENLPAIMEIFNSCPQGGLGEDRLQVCFFSATLHSPAITSLSQKICQNPTWVDLKGVDSVPETVHHVVYTVDIVRDSWLLTSAKTRSITDQVHVKDTNTSQKESHSQMLKEIKMQALLQIIDKFQMSQCMIFCRTNVDCDNLEKFLTAHGGGQKFREKAESGKENPYSCCVLAGMRSMTERRQSLESFKDGYVRFLICTDVAARGIDIAGLPYVINMTLPDDAENYIHRIGRVGRAERMGLAISIIAPENVQEKVWYHKCSKKETCQNRQLLDKGGCCTYMDEYKLAKAVEARLHMDTDNGGKGIPQLSDKFALPEEIASLNIVYGETAGTVDNKYNPHLDLIAPMVKELAELEMLSQNSFLIGGQMFRWQGK